MAELTAALDEVLRRERGRITGALLRFCGSLDAAEEALQEAATTALVKWREQGVPDNPGAWLTTVAKNHARDVRRRRGVAEAHAALFGEDDVQASPDTLETVRDDALRLVFTCCHPGLTVESQIALTLKIIAGFSTEEIARAFVCPEATISQRILRAKKTIADDGLAYAAPEKSELPARVAGVLGVLYSMFNEGHTSRSGPLMRLDLQTEALRLARLLGELVPDDPEVFGLSALMAFGVARAATRVDDEGFPILLSRQDRSRWDKSVLREGLLALQRARSLRGRGPYAMQAEIAACHVTSPSWDATDWSAIAALYDELLAASGSPIVALNRAIAVSMRDGPAAGLALLREVEEPLAHYHLFYAARADMRERMGEDARADLERALELATNDAERALLRRRIEERDAPR